METKRRLALLIDADNAQAALLPHILEEVKKHGVITISRVYGDWTIPQLGSWKAVTNTYALQPVQQFSYTSGKNSTDGALIIDAMDFIYSAGIDGICIVSSDSDYTRLAHRIREKNLLAIGVGRKTTLPAFVNACDIFIYTEDLQPPANSGKKAAAPVPKKPATEPKPKKATAVLNKVVATVTETTKKKTAAVPNSTAQPATETKKKKATNVSNDTARATIEAEKKKARLHLKGLIQAAFVATVQPDGWAHLGTIGSTLQQLEPKFDSRTYGHKSLSELVEDFSDYIEVKKLKSKGDTHVIYIRLKQDSKSTK